MAFVRVRVRVSSNSANTTSYVVRYENDAVVVGPSWETIGCNHHEYSNRVQGAV